MMFRFSVVRYAPSIARGEAINIGVLLETPSRGLYARFAGRLSRVRTLFPDADVATIKLLRDHFLGMRRATDPRQEQFAFALGGPSLDELHRITRNTSLEVGEPLSTLGEDPEAEVRDLFDTFVSLRGHLDAATATALAPSQFKRHVRAVFRHVGLLRPGRLEEDFTVRGTLTPWVFDFGTSNGETTLVQSLALRADVATGMNRAALLHARVEDVTDVKGQRPVSVIAVAEERDGSHPAVKYLSRHDINVVAAEDHKRLSRLAMSLSPGDE